MQPSNLSEENQALQSENKNLRERLLELYLQINTLSTISHDFAIPIPSNGKSGTNSPIASDYSFIQTEHTILQTGAVYSAAVSPSGDQVALSSINGAVTILTSSLKPVITLNAHNLSCRDVFWGASSLVSCGFDKTVKVWDVEKQKSQDIGTGGLCHSVCGHSNDSNSILCATGESVLWIDKRRQTPVRIPHDSPITSVTTFRDQIIYGGYDGSIYAVDKRALQNGSIWKIGLEGGAVSSLSRVLVEGQCVVTTSKSQPVLLEINTKVNTSLLAFEPPMRFGCRADITEKNLIFGSDFSSVCGGRMAAFCSGLSEPFLFEDVGGFDYGAIFLSEIAQKVLTYSEDGVIAVWSIKQA